MKNLEKIAHEENPFEAPKETKEKRDLILRMLYSISNGIAISLATHMTLIRFCPESLYEKHPLTVYSLLTVAGIAGAVGARKAVDFTFYRDEN